jgi:hypothetical protein
MWLLSAAGICGMIATHTSAQSSGGAFRITSEIVTAGGGRATGGKFLLTGSFGQVATATLAASYYRIYSGYWTLAIDPIFTDGFGS